jgi:hypothetical protein
MVQLYSTHEETGRAAVALARIAGAVIYIIKIMASIEEFGLNILHRIRTSRDARWRRLPRLRSTSAPNPAALLGVPQPTIYYLCPDLDRPSGGVRAIYRHVDTLNASGIAAVVLHHRSRFACSWFDHSTKVTGAEAVTLKPSDILVIPEWYGRGLSELPAGQRVVIFNQNAYRTFIGTPLCSPGAPYRTVPGIAAILVVSRDNADYMRYAFPDLRVELIRNIVDRNVFYPSKTLPGRRIALMPRRRKADSAQVLHLLCAR